MDKALKAKWLEALRSGRYKQGKFRLRNNRDEFCCLGVLCDISGEGEWTHTCDISGEGEWTHTRCKGYSYWKEGKEADVNVLPLFVSNFANLTDVEEEVLIDKNDGDGLSFKEIADWIEENIKED